MSSKEFALGSIDLGDDIEDPHIQNILADIEKLEEAEDSDIRFIKDVRIIKIEQEKKNIFSSRNVYVVQTKPFDWVVRRRQSDFKWLYERLTREFPDIEVSHKFRG